MSHIGYIEGNDANQPTRSGQGDRTPAAKKMDSIGLALQVLQLVVSVGMLIIASRRK